MLSMAVSQPIRLPHALDDVTDQSIILIYIPRFGIVNSAGRSRSLSAGLFPNDEIRLVDQEKERVVAFGYAGELCFRGPSSTRGYFSMPETDRTSFTADGFFGPAIFWMSAALASASATLSRGGRSDNINCGGEKFGAEEVENVITRHRHVAAAKVVATVDRMYGEKACAYLIMRPGGRCSRFGSSVISWLHKDWQNSSCPSPSRASMPFRRLGSARPIRRRCAK